MVTKQDQVKMLDMGLIDEPSGRIRLNIDPDEVIGLAESIDKMGLLQPILVRPKGDRFEVVFGHRRFLAHQRLGKSRIASAVRDLDDVQVALMRATENVERSDISPIEEAAVYADLRDTYSMTLDQLGLKMGRSPAVIKRCLDLLKMPPQLQKAVHERQIYPSIADALWSLRDATAIDYYLSFAVEHGATREVVRGWVKDHQDDVRRKASAGVGGGGYASPSEPRPVYVPCDTCAEPMEIGQETVVRSCPSCMEIVEEMKKSFKQHKKGG